MKTTKFKEYAHYKWVSRKFLKEGWRHEVSSFTVFLCFAIHWLNDLGRIIEGRPFKRDKFGNII